jgi:hypothetical protein
LALQEDAVLCRHRGIISASQVRIALIFKPEGVSNRAVI